MQNQPNDWRTRLLGCEIDPEGLLIMAKVCAQTVDLAERGLAKAGNDCLAPEAATMDWERSYTHAPTVLTELMQCLDPAFGRHLPQEEQALGPWVRKTMAQIASLLKKADRHTDPKTGLFTEAGLQATEIKALVTTAQAQLTGMVVELQTTFDTIAALLTWGIPMPTLLAQALAGEEPALFRVLALNPHLVYQPVITQTLQQKISHRGSDFLEQLARALANRPQLRKHAMIGFILLVLWEAGLKRLTSNRLRGFLKAAGVQDLPTHQALERYWERLGLKKYVRE